MNAAWTGPARRSKRWFGPVLLLGLLSVALALGVTLASGALEYGVWWLTNTTPPVITLEGPEGVVRGPAPIGVRVDPPDRSTIVAAQVDGHPLAPGDRLVLDTTALPDGEHQVVVAAEDRSRRRNRVETALRVRSDNTPPRLTLESRPDPVAQGSTWLLRVRTDEPAAIVAALDGRPLDVQTGDGFGWSVVGVPTDARPAGVPLTVIGTDAVGNRADQHLQVAVSPTTFPEDRVSVPAGLLPLLGPEVRDTEDRRLAPTYAGVSRPHLWEGPFLRPVEGPIITRFGEIRSYNGGAAIGHHAGVDIAAPAGRPVLAANRGRVAAIDEVRLRGRVVVLDHGLGVFTTYAHLASVDVRPGEVVERGRPIATVGSTGLSTGPHLHWELWVGGVNVDPLEWLELDLP